MGANLHHDLITSKAVTAILHMLNELQFTDTVTDNQTVETAAFGSDFVAERTGVDLRSLTYA